jgi:hypothetical protein
MLQRKKNSRICAMWRQTNDGRKVQNWPQPSRCRRDSALAQRRPVSIVSPPDPNRSDFQRMPRYFFNTRIGDELITDPEGEELRNPDRAWEIARAMIRELLKSEGAQSGLLNAILEVTDDEGEIVLEFPFTEAILDISNYNATKH